MADRMTYDKSIGSEDRSVVSATKLWGIVLAVVVLLGIIAIGSFLMWGSRADDGRRINSENTSRPAEP